MIKVLFLFIFIAAFAWLQSVRSGRLFNSAVFFNLYAVLYFCVGIYLYSDLVYLGGISGTLELIWFLCFIAVLSFNLSYIIFTRNINRIVPNGLGYIPRYDTLFFIVVVAILAEVFVIGIVGPYNYFFVDRLDRFPILKKYQSVLYLVNLVDVSLPFIMARYFLTRSSMDKCLMYFVIMHNLFFAIMLISRSALVYNFICIFFFLELHGYIKRRTLVLSGVGMALLMFFYKGLLYGLILDQEYESFNPGEFINWIRNSEIIMNHAFDSSFLPNNSYWLAVKSIFVISPEEQALSEWFIAEFYSDRVVSGLTYGFSGLIEGYLYLGTVGVFLHFFFFGFVFAVFERAGGALRLMLTVTSIYVMYRLFRSELYNFVKTYVWFYLYQFLIIYFFDQFLRWISASRRGVV